MSCRRDARAVASTARPLNEPFVGLQYPLAATYGLVAVARPGAGRVAVVWTANSVGLGWQVRHTRQWRQTFTLPTPATGMLVGADGNERAVDHLVLRPSIHSNGGS